MSFLRWDNLSSKMWSSGRRRTPPQLCTSNRGDTGAANHLKKSYSTSVLLNLRISRSPVLVAEYLNGERHWQSLHNFSCDEVRFDKGIYTTWYRCTSLHNAHLCHYKYVVHACLWPSDPPIVTTWILQVGAWMDYYRTHSGREFMDQFKMHYTDYASIQVAQNPMKMKTSSIIIQFQGYWNPHTHADPRIATAEFPHPQLSEAKNLVSVTEIFLVSVMEIFQPFPFLLRKAQLQSNWSCC